MNPKRKRWLILAAGWGFILLGIVGLFLPVLQGILFLLVGLMILSAEYVWAHKVLTKLRDHFPKLAARIDEASEKGRAFMRRTQAD